MRFGTKTAVVVCALVAAAIAGAAVGITLAVDSGGRKATPAKPGYLYAQDAHDGTLVRHGGPGEYDLTLYGVHPTALQFLDRPGNSVAAMPEQQFLGRFFTARGTIGAPPNAAINALVPQRGNHQYLMGVTLLSAHYDKTRGILRYHVRALRQGAQQVREHGRTDVVLPAKFGHTSVFIDDYFVGAEALYGTATFAATGVEQEFVVPSGINSVAITCNGAQGGTGNYNGGAFSGGLGASVTATFGVTAGETLYIYVGGQGENNSKNGSPPAGAGGFNGGGDGGSPRGWMTSIYGAGGGGASEVRIGSDTASAAAVVCGGGGAGGTTGVGGNGGAPTGGDGQLAGPDLNDLNGAPSPGIPGKGATQTAGGAGGPASMGVYAGVDGQDGSLSQGGSGAGGTAGGGGGGGGGGYYGGGGGSADDFGTSGPGGGGSSWVAGGAGSVSMSAGTSAGGGSVTIAEYVPSAIDLGPVGF